MTDHVIAPMHNQRLQKLSQLQVTAQYNYVIGVKKKNASLNMQAQYLLCTSVYDMCCSVYMCCLICQS